MEKRKVVKTGGTTLILSLPKPWANKIGLQPGDEIGVMEQIDGTLLLDPVGETRIERSQAEIDLKSYPKIGDMHRALQAKYLQGYTEFNIRHSGSSLQGRIVRDIKNSVKTLTGFEIIDNNSESIVVKDLLDPMELPIKKALGREITLSKLMVKNTYKVFEELNEELAKDIIYWDEEVQKFYMLIYRQIRRASSNPRLAKTIGMEGNLYPIYINTISRYLKELSANIAEMMYLFLEMDEKSKKAGKKLWNSMKINRDNFINEYESLTKAMLTKNDKIANKAIDMFQELGQKIKNVKNIHLGSNQLEQITYKVLDHMEKSMSLMKEMAIETTLNA